MGICENCINLDCNKDGLICMCGQSDFMREGLDSCEYCISDGKTEKTAKFANEVYQRQLLDSEPEYECNKHQPYFEFKIDGKSFSIGLSAILECVAVAEKTGEIPNLGKNFWDVAEERFNVAFHEIDVELEE